MLTFINEVNQMYKNRDDSQPNFGLKTVISNLGLVTEMLLGIFANDDVNTSK